MRSCGSPISSTAHITFCTLAEVFRPQTLITCCLSPISCSLHAGLTRGSLPTRRVHRIVAWIAGSSPAMTIGGSLDTARLLRQHDRDAVADRVGELGRTRDQFLLLRVVFERRLGQRTDQDFQQL